MGTAVPLSTAVPGVYIPLCLKHCSNSWQPFLGEPQRHNVRNKCPGPQYSSSNIFAGVLDRTAVCFIGLAVDLSVQPSGTPPPSRPRASSQCACRFFVLGTYVRTWCCTTVVAYSTHGVLDRRGQNIPKPYFFCRQPQQQQQFAAPTFLLFCFGPSSYNTAR